MGMVVVMEGYGSDDGDDSDSVGKHGGGDGNDGRMWWFVMVILEVMGRGMVIMMVLIVMIGIREVMVWVGGSPPATLSLPQRAAGSTQKRGGIHTTPSGTISSRQNALSRTPGGAGVVCKSIGPNVNPNKRRSCRHVGIGILQPRRQDMSHKRPLSSQEGHPRPSRVLCTRAAHYQ